MTPFFFGTSDRRLFGVYEPSRRDAGRSGVVLCYPSGQEYVPAHKAFKFLASLLAEAGHDVLRFDYHGTGDSGGDLDEGTPASWCADLSEAIDELKDTAGTDRISLCGLRMGAAWAAQAAAERSDVTRVVAWDPVLDGRAYLDALEQSAWREGDTLDDQGFAVTAETRAQFAAVTPATYTGVTQPMLVMLTQVDAVIAPAMRSRSGDEGPIDVECVPGACVWEEGELGPGGLPVRALRRIAEWLE